MYRRTMNSLLFGYIDSINNQSNFRGFINGSPTCVFMIEAFGDLETEFQENIHA